MKLTTAEKLVIGTNVFLSLVLLALLGLQFIINRSDIDVRQLLKPLTPTSALVQQQENNTKFTVEVPEPTAEEEIGAKQPRQAWVGWAIIISSSLLASGGLIAKFIRR